MVCQRRDRRGQEKEKHTLKDGAGQVTLVLAATGSGGRTVRVGVLPLLEEFFGLVEEDLSGGEGGKSQRAVVAEERLSCRDRIENKGRVMRERRNSLSVVSARGRCCWPRRESECTWPGRARGDGGRTSRGPA